MGHSAHCKKCKSAFLKTLEEEFGEVTRQWKSGWPCRIEDILNHSAIKNASSIMKCNTWESRKEDAILSAYAKRIHSFNHARKG